MAAGGPSRSERKAAERVRRLREEQQRERLRQVSRILRKAVAERSAEEGRLLAESEDLVTELQGRSRRREGLKRRQEEVCDDPEELRRKVRELAGAVRNAKYLVVYTGAGISTAASIPDYRGPNGVWTLLQKGRSISAADLSEAEPTLTHMSIARLHEQKLVQHVVSQNCDGLHLRSGLPRTAISELHGNMYIEVLKKYPRLWCMTKPPSRRPKLYIVNLQWTPKDDWAALKLHGKCDDVMQLLMDELGLEIPPYSRWQDPIFTLATPLRAGEEGSHSRKSLCRSREDPPPGDRGAALSSAPVLGGWFGRGCAKRTKRRKIT
ncbi:NAD-dependent protein deacetylase sirtuin-7 isoform X3 [Canis lupus baileyi]|uniref:NAD-dependent protein deacetylase sirtuin-7 isoform X4 n=1 Tax=Canis lupus familiaris TaxID=9615 RepID=UPI000BAA066B|nr:NAD-dependent protein deacetylase sirtuin-7 isoform X4 [Canis lupus familiaris]XP_025324114.1 NAD-dependent protein deacetylase sirtuin-7 isoform X4 [Canis lupus dingo]XP_038402223.1 NAD-dependent protein deacetylase sirtuin-7 isoform X4 [Canis lupus familiaris]XP_038531344.1 NAD-dependent protein deacetylase sirtuin-7 isoform X4 [Canis lupus familiaris]|eukprot:XP_022278328.1 NAD-dependent protein deacetylase sirtuin-7 isoform X2 [Canis lupus familiaris]